MEAILVFLFSLFGVLQCAMDFVPLTDARKMELMALGDCLIGVSPTPLGFDKSVYDYNYSYPMCAARQNGPSFVCPLTFTAYVEQNSTCTTVVSPSPINLGLADILVPRTVTITATHSNGSSWDYRIAVTLLPSTDGSIKSLTANGNFTPAFASATTDYQLAALTQTQATITLNVTLAQGATLTINSVAQSNPLYVITMNVSAKCVPQTYVLVVTAEDGVTQNTYTINAYLPDLTVPDSSGSILADKATALFNAQLDLPKVTLDLYEQISINSNIALELIYLEEYDDSASTYTITQLVFLPAPCGSSDYGKHYFVRFYDTKNITYQFRLAQPDNTTNTSFYETNITSLVIEYSQPLLYCLDTETNITLYGDVCKPPAEPKKKGLSAEVGVAIATTLVIAIVVMVLAADAIWGKLYGERDGGKELAGLELRETISKDETIPDNKTPREAAPTVATEDP